MNEAVEVLKAVVFIVGGTALCMLFGIAVISRVGAIINLAKAFV